MTDLRVVSDDETTDEAPAEGGFTVGDAAHSIAELASSIHKRFKGWTPAEALKAVELAMGQHMAERQMALAYGPGPMPTGEPDPEVLRRLEELTAQAEDDPTVQAEIPTQEGY